MARGLNRPPIWATVVMVVAAVLLAVGVPAALGRGELTDQEVAAARQAAEERADARASEAAASSSAAAASAPPEVVVFGDSYTAGSNNTQVWPDLLGGSRGWQVTNLGVGGSGYVSGQQTMVVQSADISTYAPDLVMFVGSRNDQYYVDQVYDAALTAYQQVQATYPAVPIVVVGPIWDSTEPPDAVAASAAEVQRAAADAGVAYVDALSQNWLGDPAIVQADGVHPTDQGEQVLAERIGAALDALGTTVSPLTTP